MLRCIMQMNIRTQSEQIYANNKCTVVSEQKIESQFKLSCASVGHKSKYALTSSKACRALIWRHLEQHKGPYMCNQILRK